MIRRMLNATLGSISLAGLLMAAYMPGTEPMIGHVAQDEYFGATGTRIGATPRNLYFQEAVYAEEEVKTSQEGGTELQFLDRSHLHMGANTTIVLNRYVYDPETQDGSAVVVLISGAIRYVSGLLINKRNISLRTQVANVGLRGTELLMFVLEDDTTQIDVLGGVVKVTPCRNRPSLEAEAGERIIVCASCVTFKQTVPVQDAPSRVPSLPSKDDLPKCPVNIIMERDAEPLQNRDGASGSIGGEVGGGVGNR
jgi:hypothetical protein